MLGATFASMFPDRVGRLILDGVGQYSSYVPETLLIRPFSRRRRVCGTSLDRKLVGYQQKLRFLRNILSQGSQAL
jgi:pimeloyl-ACP methyl ester carboxylesterase